MTKTTGTPASDGISRVLRERRTVHDFTAEVPPVDLLSRAIDLARWAPNHRRTEPWHFYLLDRASAERIVELNTELVRAGKGDKVAGIKQQKWLEMPGWLVVTCTTNCARGKTTPPVAAPSTVCPCTCGSRGSE